MTETATGTGGFTVTAKDYPVKLSLDSASSTERAASGLPNDAVRLLILRAGLPASVDVDDQVTVTGTTYRVIKVETDVAAASFVVTAVPA
jgi:hypothetical protein